VRKLVTFIFLLITLSAFANDNILNIYLWSSDIPDTVVQQFEKETHIKVNYSTYDSNETLYAKFLASDNPGYDVIEPSSYYVKRMRNKGMLMKIDKSQIPNLKYLSDSIKHPDYDPNLDYSIPSIWGVTGIFVNKKFYDPAKYQTWSSLFNPALHDNVLVIDDIREVFSAALISIGLSPNTSNPAEIKAGYKRILAWLPNIKLFAGDAIPTIITDEDANIGMAWNGDVFLAQSDNPDLIFIYPQDGFVAWSDNLAIPKGAKHVSNAYKFINFLERPDINAQIIENEGYPTGNDAAKKYLPADMQNSTVLFPPDDAMKRAIWQDDIDDKALATYEHYWELVKLKA